MFLDGNNCVKKGDENLVIEPVASIELAKFYSIED